MNKTLIAATVAGIVLLASNAQAQTVTSRAANKWRHRHWRSQHGHADQKRSPAG